MYANGEGVPQDHAEAVRWYRMAAEQGNAGAQGNLCVMYYEGQGVPQDYVTAHMWFNLGAAKGAPGVDEARDALGKEMSPADLSEAQRRARVCLETSYQDCD